MCIEQPAASKKSPNLRFNMSGMNGALYPPPRNESCNSPAAFNWPVRTLKRPSRPPTSAEAGRGGGTCRCWPVGLFGP